MKKLLAGLALLLTATTASGAIINGPLVGAQLEPLASPPGTPSAARIYYDTGTGLASICNGATCSSIVASGSAALEGLTGDVVATGPGTVAATITDLARSKLAPGTANALPLNDGTGAVVAEITPASCSAGEVVGYNGATFECVTDSTGSGISDLTGDVTATGPGSAVATITDLARSKLADGTPKAIPLNDGSGALVDEITPASCNSGEVIGFDGTDFLCVPDAAGDGITELTGDVTATGPGSAAATITDLARSKLADGTANALVVNDGSGALSEITPASCADGEVIKYASGSGTFSCEADAAGDGITELTGDVTATGPGSSAATVVTVGGETAADVATSVTDTQAATATNTVSTIVKRDGSGNFAAGTITADLSGNASTATALAANPTDCGSDQFASSIAANGNLTCSTVPNAGLANMAESTIKGRAAGVGTGAPVDLSATQATAILNNMVGDSGSGGTKGLVPAPAAGDAAAGKYLKADGTWDTPAGGGGSIVEGIAKVECDGSPRLLSNIDGMLSTTVTGSSSAGCTVTWATNFFGSGVTPDCVVTAHDNAGNIAAFLFAASIASIGTSNALIYRNLINEAAGPAVQTNDGDFTIYCRGTGP